ALARALVLHSFATNVRELDSLPLRSIVGSRGATLELTEELDEELRSTPAKAHAKFSSDVNQSFTAEQIRSALEKHGGIREKVWRELGMANRYVLKRLIKKFGIADE